MFGRRKRVSKKINKQMKACLEAASTLTSLIDGGDSRADGLAKALTPARDLLLEFATEANRCWCPRCERDRFWRINYHIRALWRKQLRKESLTDEVLDPVIWAIFDEVMPRWPTGVAETLYMVITLIVISDLEDAVGNISELEGEAQLVIDGMSGEPCEPCERKRCKHCDFPLDEGRHEENGRCSRSTSL